MKGVSPNFGTLLRDARWTRWHKEQVYTAPQAFRAVGDWGFKQRMTSPYAYDRVEARGPSPADVAGGSGSTPRTTAATADFVAHGGLATRFATPAARMGMLRHVKVRNLAGTFDNKVLWKETERAVLFRQAWFDKGAHTAGFMEAYHKRKFLPSQGIFGGAKEFRRPAGSLGLPPRTIFDEHTLRADVTGKVNASIDSPRPRSGLKIPGLETAPTLKAFKSGEPAARNEEAVAPQVWGQAAYILDKRLSVPNYHMLSPKSFQKFVQVIQSQRPALVKELSANQQKAMKLALAKTVRDRAIEQAKQDPAAVKQLSERSIDSWLAEVPSLEGVQWLPPDLWNAARSTDRKEMTEIIRRKSDRHVFGQQDSTIMPHQLGRRDRVHPSAGLMYAQPDEIYTNVLNPAVPGRVVTSADGRQQRGGALSRLSQRRTSALAVSSGGHIEQVPSAVKGMLLAWNMRRASNPHSEAQIRVMDADMAVPGKGMPWQAKPWSRPGEQAQKRLNRASYVPKKMGVVQAKSRPVKAEAEATASFAGSSHAVAGRIYRPGQQDLSSLQRLDASMDAKLGEGAKPSARTTDLEEMLKGVNSVLRSRAGG